MKRAFLQSNCVAKMVALICFLILIPGWGLSQSIQDIPPELLAYPDMIFYNGEVLTADDNFTIAQAVAVRGDKILKVGSDADIQRLKGPSTEMIDLHGRSLIPGFFDTHLHQAWVGQIAKGESAGGFESVRKGRVNFHTVSGGLDEVKQVVATVKPGQWIFLSGPDGKALLQYLTLKDLDGVSPANPVVITTTNNLAFVNSIVLKQLDWNMGGVELDPKTKKPTGRLSGFAVGVVTYEKMPQPGRASPEALQDQQDVLRELNSEGLTTIIGRGQGLTVTVLTDLWRQHLLTARVRIATEFLRQNPNAEDYLKRLGDFSGLGDAWMKIIGATVQPVDGTNGAGATYTDVAKRQQLPDDPFGPHGQDKYQNWGSTLDKSEYHAIILANRYGWNILSIHCQGDAAADLLLQAFAQANKEAPLQGVWAFDHGLFRSSENIAEAKKLGVIFSVDAKYLFDRTPTDLVYQYGEEVHKMTPLRNMIDAGMEPTGETDNGGKKYSSPLFNIQAMVTRTDETGKVWGPNQKLTKKEALWMRTNWASRYSADQDILGTITAGKLADLVVLGDDYMKVPDDKISAIPIDMTIVGGKVVYDRAKDGVISYPIWDRTGGAPEGN